VKAASLLARIPVALTALRALLAPVVVLLACFHPVPWLFAACLVLALVSDVLDGMLARRWEVSTPMLRRLDSIADTLFYLAAAFAAWRLYPAVITQHLAALVVLAGLEIARYLFDFLKFGRETSYHMWSSKLWGLLLFAGFFSLLALGRPGLAFTLSIYVGILADLEGLAISMLMREWRSDVPSFVHALRSRGS
jgi:CDP-diacylglycerol--glycerol-3-phosphate 3-phosphatidyltransferase